MELHIPDGLLNDKMMIEQKQVFITHDDVHYKLTALTRGEAVLSLRFEPDEKDAE